MATLKFKDASSPYKQPLPSPPPEDYIFQKYLEDLAPKKELHHPKIKLALFGVGRAGTIHLSNIIASPRVKLLYIVDDLESNWESIKEHWHLEDVMFLTSEESSRVYRDLNVDAVIVASPTYTHEAIVTRSLEAKKAVFCEKPVAQDRLNTVRCYETARKVGKPLFCAFNRRFDPCYSTVRQRVRKGEVGHVHVIKTVARDSPLPGIEYLKTSGGIFHDCMVHDFDLITWILGEYPNKVAVRAHAHIPEIKALGDYDTVVATLHFPSGTLGVIDISRNSPVGYDQRLEVFGPKGLITADNERPLHSVTMQRGLQGATQAPIWYSFASRFMNGYRRELDHFINVVLGKSELSVTSEETLAVCKIACACEESAKTGKMVEINWPANEIPRNTENLI
ncbi:PREDICTED: inositol 2-dehydrogenase-like [Dufourea novaeangliae]|uniref:Putative oxidoreductase YrbE n=1 Tax=Dufourea novaeangliae TaxID=178035 RepID=A0A154PA81_DUFNO|nr:PREDICTED: inositol 2-dehydrogenase-like [Dufourea novaeangliae]KZC08846.1 putative oxidoreductase YrbE [Dufourea novaeangliae]